MRTKTKIALARLAQRVVMIGRRLVGAGGMATCRRGGLNWRLDLAQGVDFSIFMLGGFEPGTIAVYRRMIRPGAMVIDIGANIGAHTLPLAAAVGSAGRVVAVEPTRYAVDRLRENLSLNPDIAARVTVFQSMLMASSDAALAPAIESSWPLETPGEAHAEHAGVAMTTAGATVRTLDALVEELGLAAVDFIKLDVDGYEVDVLRGAQRTLARFKPVIFFEHAPYVIAEKGRDPHEIATILTGHGYRFSGLSGQALALSQRTLPVMAAGTSVNLLAWPDATPIA